MGRIALVIDAKELEAELLKLETNGTFENRSRLYEALCQTSWAKGIKDALGRSRGLTPANVYQRVKEFNLEAKLKTPQGKRGNPHLGQSSTPRNRAESMKNKKGYLLAINRLRADFKKESERKLLAKLEKGSLKAGIALKCRECVCRVLSEAGRCTVFSCPLYLISPYTGKYHDGDISSKDLELLDKEIE